MMDATNNGAHEFLAKIDKDPKLQAEMQEAQANILEIAKQHGFVFTLDELHDELRKRWEISKPKDDPNTCTVTVG